MFIFKIVHASEWNDAARAGCYYGSIRDRQDGFLHFSTAEQLEQTLEKYYSGTSDLILVAVDSEVLGEALKFEPSSDGILFPHLYGALRTGSVRWTTPIPLRPGGTFDLPPDLATVDR